MTITLDLDKCASDSTCRRMLSSLSLSVAKCKKIVVVTGAGISCSSGIPDFRSSDGLYNLVKQQYPDVVLKGRDLFDASLFRDSTSTSVFYTFISQLKRSCDAATPTPTHRFIKTLDAKNKLLRSYTQNIDGLEERTGMVGSSSQEVKMNGKGKAKIKAKNVRNVQLHGDIHRVRCTFCSAEFPCTQEHLDLFNTGVPPDCPECTSRSDARRARSARALKVGTLRPAIVLYDEPHPLGDDIGAIQTADINRKPDMLIIMGTSLKVHGFKKLVRDFARAVRQSAPPSASSSSSPPKNAKHWAGKVVFVNKTAPGSEWDGIIDYHVAGETDRWVEKVIEDWKKMRPADWEVQKTLVATGLDTSGTFTAARDITAATASKGKGGKGPLGNENIPPWDEVAVTDSTHSGKPSSLGLPQAPPSPSKRRSNDCHYSDVECSPSKKRDAGDHKEPVEFEDRGMLFADSTNIAGKSGERDSFDLGELKPLKLTKRSSKAKMEIVIDGTRKSTRVRVTTAKA